MCCEETAVGLKFPEYGVK